MNHPEFDVARGKDVSFLNQPIGRGRCFCAEHSQDHGRCMRQHYGVVLMDDNFRARCFLHFRIAADVIHMAVRIDDIINPQIIF